MGNEYGETGPESPPVKPVVTVKDLYDDLRMDGMSAKEAAKEAQRRTGLSVVSGMKIKEKGPTNKTKRKWTYGEYD